MFTTLGHFEMEYMGERNKLASLEKNKTEKTEVHKGKLYATT
jgi:hypothetical protein